MNGYKLLVNIFFVFALRLYSLCSRFYRQDCATQQVKNIIHSLIHLVVCPSTRLMMMLLLLLLLLLATIKYLFNCAFVDGGFLSFI